jgi:hypothetical protein
VSRPKQHKGNADRPQSPTLGAGGANSLASLLAPGEPADHSHIGSRPKWPPHDPPKLPIEAIGRIKWEIGDAEFFFIQRSGGLPKSDPAAHDRQLEPLVSDWALTIYRRFLKEGKQALSSGIWTREEFAANTVAFLADVGEGMFQKLEVAAILAENRTWLKVSEIVDRVRKSEDLVTLMRSAKVDLFEQPAKSETVVEHDTPTTVPSEIPRSDVNPDTVVSVPFTHSEDYRTVTIRGETYNLTKRQVQIIKILHEAYKTGNPDVPISALFKRLGTPESSYHNAFRSRPGAKKALITTGDSKGTIRLNLKPGRNTNATT